MNHQDDKHGGRDDAADDATEAKLPFEHDSDAPYEPAERAYDQEPQVEPVEAGDESGGQASANAASDEVGNEPELSVGPDETDDEPEPQVEPAEAGDESDGQASTNAASDEVGDEPEPQVEPAETRTDDVDVDGTAIIPAIVVTDGDDAAPARETDRDDVPDAPQSDATTPIVVPPPVAAPRPSSSPAAYRTPAEQAWVDQSESAAASSAEPVSDDPLDGLGDESAPSRWPKVALWTGAGLIVLGGLYVGAQWGLADTVPRGTTVAGVDIGGMGTDEAVQTVDDELGPRAAEPLEVAAGEATTSIDPVAAGLTFDANATVQQLTDFSLNPVRLWEQLFGGDEAELVVDVDNDELGAAISAAASGIDVPPVDGTVSFSGAEVVVTDAVDGTAVVVEEASSAITESWLVSAPPVELLTEQVSPEVTQEETDSALAEAETVVSGAVIAQVGDQSPELPPEALGDAASYAQTDGVLVLGWDGDALDEAIVSRTNDLLTTAEDAHFEFVGGKPKVVGGETGTRLDSEQVIEAVGAAAVSTDERTAEIEIITTDPENSAEALEALGVKEKIVEFSTPLTNEPVRTQNLVIGASKVNGTLVKPGENFSVTKALAPITAANGYGAAHVITDGLITEGTGGGLSQMATNTYNIGFFAGYEDVTHKPHSYYYSRYPEGRESTMYEGSIDMVWTNDTPYGVLLQSWVGGNELHTVAWSTPYWDVSTSTGSRRDVVEPTTQEVDSPDCEPTSAGGSGFSVTVTRKVSHDGTVDKDEAKSWTYKPQNAIECE